MMKRMILLLMAVLLGSGTVLAHEGEEAGPVDPDEAVAQSIAFLRAEPPNLMEAQERLEAVAALESSEEVSLPLVRAAAVAVEADATPEAIQLLERALGREPEPLGSLVEVSLGTPVYWAFGLGVLLVGLGAYGLGRRGGHESAAGAGGRGET